MLNNNPPEESDKSRRLLMLQRRLSVWALALVIMFFALHLAGHFADVLRILGISVLLSYLLINVVDFLEKYLRLRALSIAVVYAGLIVVTVVAAVVVLPAVVFQVSQMLASTFEQIPDLIGHLNQWLSPLEARLQAAHVPIRAIDILGTVATSIPRPEPGLVLGRLVEMTVSTMAWLVYLLSVLVVSYYMLLEGHRMRDAIIRLFPPRYHSWLQGMTEDMDASLQSFFRGQIVLGVFMGAVMLVVYLGLDIQYALLLAVFLGFWEIVPVIGPPIGFIPAVISVALHGMKIPVDRLLQVLIITIIFNVLQQIKDNVIAPRYMGNVIGLHPILIFVAIMIGARLDGVLGIIFALPVACVINVFCHHWSLRDMSEDQPIADVASEEPEPVTSEV